MGCTERGLALVTILLLLAMLLVLALVLTDKTLRAARGSALAGARQQGLLAAGAGLEWARRPLAARYLASPGWAADLAAAPAGESYPAQPALTATIGGIPVSVYLRDNPDGDGDDRRDSDLQLFVLACARPPGASEVRVESQCGFVWESGSYRQAGEDCRRSGQARAAGPEQPWQGPVHTFRLSD